MAKKKIENYVFRPGISYQGSLFPDEYTSFVNNLAFIQAEITGYINYRVEIDTAVNLLPNAVRILQNNVNFIKKEATAWIAGRVAVGAEGFSGYSYDEAKCERDIGYVVNAYIHDVRYGGNESTRTIASKYWINDEPQVDGDRLAEVKTHQFIRDLITDYILPLSAYTPLQTTATRYTTGPAAETSAAGRIDTLSAIIYTVIDEGLGSLPAIDYKSATFENYTYNQEKCTRDLGYVLNSYLHDLRYGGTEHTVKTVKKYFDTGILQVDGSGKAEVEAHTFIRNLIKNQILQNQSGTILYPEASRLLTLNKTFLQQELNAWIANEITEATKCERDIGYILDGAAYDIALGTNYNAVFLGLAEYNSLDNDFFVIDTIQRTQTAVDELAGVAASAQAVARVNAYFDEVVDIAQNGRAAANTLVFPEPSNATASRINIKNQLLTNIDFITTDVNAFVAANYPSADHDVDKCTRDVKYAINALIYDMLYGGNSATYDQAKFFFYSFSAGAPGIDPTHQAQTVAAYVHLKGLVGQIVQNQSVTAQEGNLLTQDRTNPPASAADAIVSQNLVQITADVIAAADQSAANTVLAAITRTVPSVSWTAVALQTAASAIIANKTSIISQVVVFKNYTYDSAKCIRDSGYLLDAIISDLTNNGNEETRRIIQKYYIDGQFQIDGSRIPEIAAYNFIRGRIIDYIFPLQLAPKFQTTYSQIRTAPAGETGATARIDELFSLITNFFDTGPTSLPALSVRTVPYQEIEVQEVDTTKIYNAEAGDKITQLSDILINAVLNGEDTIPSPEQAGYGQIKFTGAIKLEDLLLITNTTRNEVIYNFSNSSTGGVLVLEFEEETDYQTFLQTSDRVCKLNLTYDTSSHDLTDELQIFVEVPEISTRPYEFGTDAIERQRVAAPQSMLDADFEYGLQPTKWQAIGVTRGYPSIYEIPGSDFEVTSVTSDASFPTNGVGSSLITVTTTSPHGLSEGTPVTVSGLDTSVSGFNRAEGSFVIVTVPTIRTFTFYSKSRVGSTAGIELATTYTQVRKGGFYTGADIGNPTIEVESNGSSGTFTTVFDSLSGESRFAFTGEVPDVGAPLTAVVGLGYGAQVTAVVGSGGVVTVPEVLGDYPTETETLTVASTSGVVNGLATENLSGAVSFVESIVGNDLTFTKPFTTAIVGNTTTYNGLSGTNEISLGVGATFDVTGNTLGYTNVFVASGGSDYQQGDILVITGDQLSGTTPANDLIIQVSTVGVGGVITAATIVSGTSALQLADETINGVNDTTYSVNSPDSVVGTGATFDITRVGTAYSAVINAAGSGYVFGTQFTIPGNAFTGGLEPENNLTIGVQSTEASFTGLSQDETSGSGTLAQFDITRSDNAYVLDVVAFPGSGYAVNDTVVIYGTQLGGNWQEHDLTLLITNVGPSGEIITAEVPLGLSIADQNAPGSLLTIQTTGLGNENETVSGVTAASAASVGYNGSFNITRTSGGYSNPIVIDGGQDYVVGNRIRILGSELGGEDSTNDCIVTVTDADEATGEILAATVNGVGADGIDLSLYSSMTVSEPNTATIADGTDIEFGNLATLNVNFVEPHGVMPGGSFIVVVTSDSGSNNHILANGSFSATEVPTRTSLRFLARAPGIIDDSTPISAAVYPRPDSFFTHRPFDGGVQLGTGGPQHGAQAIRQSKKYIRYQSGKGIMYTTGALFAPSYDILDILASDVEVGATIDITLGDNDHGLQAGASVRITGVTTGGYNGDYIVDEILTERKFRVIAGRRLGTRKPVLSFNCQVSTQAWQGAVVRAGVFDDQNGIFWEYDGQYLYCVQRTSTRQLAGVISINRDSNRVTGTNTRFRDQVTAGDTVVIRGMTHVVTHVDSQTSLTVNPDFRGVNNISNAKMSLVTEVRARQDQWNRDKLDGTGPSGYNLDITKMQMIGIEYSWYGAGFIDFMLRGADGNYVYAHRMRNSNINTEAYMRSGNLPVRYEVSNYGPRSKLSADISNVATSMTVENAADFPTTGTVYVNNELISYTGKTGNTLTGLTRSAQLNQFVAGALRNFTAGPAEDHTANTGVIFVSNTTTPLISHWGSAFLTDGLFDEDRGYIFNYTAANVSVETSKKTAFLIRLAPSVSNAVTGDLGERELLNRAQLLLQGIGVTADTGTGGIVVEGVLNPQNYPINPSDILWQDLSGSAQGGQPSFAQIAPGGSVVWSSGSTSTTATATTSANPTGTISVPQIFGGGSIRLGDTRFYITQANYDIYVAAGLAVGDSLSGTGIAANTTITNISFFGNVSGTNYYRIIMSQAGTQTVSGTSTLTVSRVYPTATTSFIFFQKASWEASGAAQGTEVSDTRFGAGTFVTSTRLETYFSTQYYRVTFNQTSNSTAIVRGTTAITFKFGQPAYALPGETIFSFVSAPGGSNQLDLSDLKELTNTTLGGRGTFPNGPDVLAINIYKASGTAVNANVVLRWGEAQA